MDSPQRTAGIAALLAALGGILYGYFFVIVGNVAVASALLMLGGLLLTFIIVVLGSSLEEVNRPLARWATGVGFLGAMLSMVHGGYDLANQIHPPGASSGDFPNPVDPRGLATFGLTGVAVLILGGVMSRSAEYPLGLARAGQALGLIMIVIYLGRLIILDPNNPVVRVALALGVIANTVFLLWIGRHWLVARKPPP
ncbi:MAG TPA: hypothetical protein VJ796_04455 [Acidimicrobiia bacterium]|nr:hypothetical protein [Acidimicrobiia bacterium]